MSDIIRIGSYLEKILENEEFNRTYVFYFYGETDEGEKIYLTRFAPGYPLGSYPTDEELKTVVSKIRDKLKIDIINEQTYEDWIGEENSEFTDVRDGT